MLIPIGLDQNSVRRLPWVTFSIMAVCLVAFLWSSGFMLDAEPTVSLGSAFVVNALLLLVFALQHSVMARPAFKAWLTKYIPTAAERSTYVLMSSLALILLFCFWQPMGGVIWDIQNSAGRVAAQVLFVLGWLTVLGTTMLINHFDLFGLRQVYLHLREREYHHLEFTTTGLYKYVRHPIMLGFIIAFFIFQAIRAKPAFSFLWNWWNRTETYSGSASFNLLIFGSWRTTLKIG